MLVKINPTFVASLEVRITISCNSRLVSVNFSCANFDHFINSFGITDFRKNMIVPDYDFIELEKIKYPLVNQFYKRVYKKGLADKSETVFILKNNQAIICSAKLKPLTGDLLLTGVACDEQYQHQGHATRLVEALLKTQNQPIYCFPYPYLEGFYLRLGFTHLALDKTPDNIQKRFLDYQKHRQLLLMVFKQI